MHCSAVRFLYENFACLHFEMALILTILTLFDIGDKIGIRIIKGKNEMNTVEKSFSDVYEIIKSDIRFDEKDFSLQQLIHYTAHKYVYGFLESIVNNAGCHDYLFIFAITKLEERYGNEIQPYLLEILDNYINFPNKFDKDIAFSAFYCLGLHYKRYNEVDKLYDHLVATSYFKLFYKEYPLSFELASRYCALKGFFDRQMVLCNCTIRKVKSLNKECFMIKENGYTPSNDNIALKVAFVSSVCSSLEQKYVRGELKNIVHIENETKMHSIEPEDLRGFFDTTSNDNICDFLNTQTIEEAKAYIEEAIVYNSNYPKYPYLKAKLMFYSALYNKEELDCDKIRTIEKLIATAKAKENPKAQDYELRCATYDRLLSLVCLNESQKNKSNGNMYRLSYLEKKQDIIRENECPPPQKRPDVTARIGNPYAFISYSSKDFKCVYCDILEMQRRGVSYWYDKGTIPSEDWEKEVLNKLENSSCVICYLSRDYLISPNTLLELERIKEYKKPVIWIDLTGKKQISKMIVDVVRSASPDMLKQLNSKMLNVITDLIQDDMVLIARDSDPLSSIHLSRVEDVLYANYRSLINDVTDYSLSVKNSKKAERDGQVIDVPNEDYLICDGVNRIYMVVDGISRRREEYFEYDGSIAQDVSRLFCQSIYDELKEELKNTNLYQPDAILRDCFEKANRNVAQMLDSCKDRYEGREKPGAVGIVAFIYNKTLYYGQVGDCMGIIVRNNRQIVFAKKQTEYAFNYLNLERDREHLAHSFINHVENGVPVTFGYGVINGEENAKDFLNISHIKLEEGDTVYLISDGVADLIQFANPQAFNSKSLNEIIELSNKQDDELKKPYFDDKSIIRIRIGVE